MAKKPKTLSDRLLAIEVKIKGMREAKEAREKKMRSLIDEIRALLEEWRESDFDADELERAVDDLEELVNNQTA